MIDDLTFSGVTYDVSIGMTCIQFSDDELLFLKRALVNDYHVCACSFDDDTRKKYAIACNLYDKLELALNHD